MNLNSRFTKIFLLFFTMLFLKNALAFDIIEKVTVVNGSAINLKPTAEGFAGGCIGGSMPPMLDPITPNTMRDINVVFIQYLPSCSFNILPQPNMMMYNESCHNVKANNTVIFTGDDELNLQCQVMSST